MENLSEVLRLQAELDNAKYRIAILEYELALANGMYLETLGDLQVAEDQLRRALDPPVVRKHTEADALSLLRES